MEKYNDERIKKTGEKIRTLRIAAGYTSHEAFAWDHNISRVQYWRIENGANITLATLLKILDIHHITLSEFFSGE